MELKDYITFGIAILGAVLGIINTISTFSQRKVRLKVTPALAFLPGGQEAFSIGIINLSTFPLVIREVGFTYGANTIKGKRIPVTQFIGQNALGKELPPRSSTSIYFDPNFLHGQKIGRAYIITACEEVAYGQSKALQQLKAKLN